MSKTELVTDFVCVATSGHTADGRFIDPQHLKEMAETYDPKTYTAVIWFEHFRWRNFGKVTEVKTEISQGENGEVVKLFARLAPSVEMIEMNKENQGIFTSIEITPNFAKTGKAYLTGLAFTDSPASLGTDPLRFNKRIGATDVQISAPQASDLSFSLEEDNAEEDNAEEQEQASLLYRLFKKLFNSNQPQEENDMDKINQLQAAIENLAAKFDQFATQPQASTPSEPSTAQAEPEQTVNITVDQFNQLMSRLDALETKFNDATKPQSAPPTGVPSGAQAGVYNVNGVNIDLSKGI